MKKTLTIVALILAITVSLIAGTMSYYYTELEELAGGSVVAKEFKLTGEGETTFDKEVKIAPGESKEWKFTFDAKSETGMDIDINIELKEFKDKKPIVPLVLSIREESVSDEKIIETKDGIGKAKITHGNVESMKKTYIVKVQWPWETAGINDIEFAGADFGSALSVKVTGTQVKP
ncbi:MAG: hypothetical protein GX849_07575 [Clostridiaceae bacterium]|nr:hypothetical protein [Clostridiaceae bacterium]